MATVPARIPPAGHRCPVSLRPANTCLSFLDGGHPSALARCENHHQKQPRLPFPEQREQTPPRPRWPPCIFSEDRLVKFFAHFRTVVFIFVVESGGHF